MISRKKMASNVITVLLAQCISIIVSFVLGLVVPKYIDEYQYAYWQTFVLYFGYIGVVPLGLLDGIVLRYSQYDYEELDKRKIATEFRVLILWGIFVAIMICFFSAIFADGEYKYVAMLVALAIVVHFFYSFNYTVFQISNRINNYSTVVIIQRVIYALLVILTLVIKSNWFVWICLSEIIGELIGGLISVPKNRGLYLTRGMTLKETFKETWLNVSSGILLMVANFSSNFLIGGAKMVIQSRWGTLTFGKVSFSFSVTNLFLTFVTAISVVLFPSLKRMKQEELPQLYSEIRGVISPILFLALLMYFPVARILEVWLPKYTESLTYLGVLLPIIIFSSMVNLLTNNYLKAYRKEKVMLLINVFCVVLGFGSALACAYIVNNFGLLLFSVVFVIILRSILSEIIVGRMIDRKGTKDYIMEILMTITFIVSTRYFGLCVGFIIYLCAFIVYVIVYRQDVFFLLGSMKKLICSKIGKRS